MSSQLEDEILASGEMERSANGKIAMTPVTSVLTLPFIFFAEFGVGYAARAWRSRRRQEKIISPDPNGYFR
jgi:hypothetical protein